MIEYDRYLHLLLNEKNTPTCLSTEVVDVAFWWIFRKVILFFTCCFAYFFHDTLFHTFYFHYFVVELTYNTLSCYLRPITFVHDSATFHFTQSPTTTPCLDSYLSGRSLGTCLHLTIRWCVLSFLPNSHLSGDSLGTCK